MTNLGWAIYLAYTKEGEDVVKHFLASPDVDLSLRMKTGYFAGKTAREMAEYFKRASILKVMDQKEDVGNQKSKENHSAGEHVSMRRMSRTHAPRQDPEEERYVKQAILSYLDACEVPINDQVAISGTLMKNGYTDLRKIVYADYKSLQRLGLKSSVVQALLSGKDILERMNQETPAPILKQKDESEPRGSILKRRSQGPSASKEKSKDKEKHVILGETEDVL